MVTDKVSISLWRVMMVQYLSNLFLCTPRSSNNWSHLSMMAFSLSLISCSLQYLSCCSGLLMAFRSLNLSCLTRMSSEMAACFLTLAPTCCKLDPYPTGHHPWKPQQCISFSMSFMTGSLLFSLTQVWSGQHIKLQVRWLR